MQSSICDLSWFSLHQHHPPYLDVCTPAILGSILVLASSTSLNLFRRALHSRIHPFVIYSSICAGNCNHHNHLSPFLFWVIMPGSITTTVNPDERQGGLVLHSMVASPPDTQLLLSFVTSIMVGLHP